MSRLSLQLLGRIRFDTVPMYYPSLVIDWMSWGWEHICCCEAGRKTRIFFLNTCEFKMRQLKFRKWAKVFWLKDYLIKFNNIRDFQNVTILETNSTKDFIYIYVYQDERSLYVMLITDYSSMENIHRTLRSTIIAFLWHEIHI